jgi:phosphate:Na+ symporter
MLTQLLGGIGLFLLGMVLLTDGLKALAGGQLRRILSRFTGGTLSSLASGATVTALVQSSSATTLATIGFVSAGLLTFPQAVGVVLGANVGTTSTGWLVAVLGFKVSVGTVALPLVGVGALLRLLGRDRLAAAGLALAGFGLLFVGIDTLQGGMEGLADRLDPSSLPGTRWTGRLLLVLVGAAMTVVLQSSSAAVATTLTALHGGAVTLTQAAALVVGQNVGTTVTAALAGLGASTAARRTALAHILFNLITGVVALLILPGFVAMADALVPDAFDATGTLTLAAFHTLFNLLGVAIMLPFIGRFARLVQRLVPSRGPALTQRLDPSVVEVAPVAVEAVRRTLRDVTVTLSDQIRALLRTGRMAPYVLEAVTRALDQTRTFLGRVRAGPESEAEHHRHLSALHALDHLERMLEACHETPTLPPPRRDARVDDSRRRLEEGIVTLRPWFEADGEPAPIDGRALAEGLATELAAARRVHRPEMLAATAHGRTSPDDALARLDSMRWLDRAAYHLWRVVHHLDDRGPDATDRGRDAARAQPEGAF